MSRVQPRARLHSSELLHFLIRQDMVESATDAGDVGQRLGDWLHFRHAIALQALIGEVDDPSALRAEPTARVDATVLRQRFAQVRSALEASITQGTAPAPGLPRIGQPDIELAHPIDPKTAFDPLRRYFNAHQRQMENVIHSLRVQLRGMLDKGPTGHKRLATLDAIFENVLLERESRLLGHIPRNFEKRFAKALQKHMKQLLESAEADESAPHTAPWLGPLLEDMRAGLLAELDLRLQPLMGLIGALTQDTPQQQ